jgi:hypothetical protein
MAGLRSRRTKADPFVIALAELLNYTVVTDETTARRPSRKIPHVCGKRGVLCICLAEPLECEK